MSDIDRHKWDQRYRDDSFRKANPVSLLHFWAPRIPCGRALDIACGAGRNTIYLAGLGFEVDAIDISAVGLERARIAAQAEGLAINWIEHDLERSFDFAGSYDLIVVFWFVNLPLIERLAGCLAPGGYLVSEQHLASEQVVIGPSDPAFRVAPGALPKAAGKLEILHYLEAVTSVENGGQLASAQLVARQRGK